MSQNFVADDPHAGSSSTGRVLDPAHDHDRALIDRLRADPAVQVYDTLAEQLSAMARLVPAPGPEVAKEPSRWVFYPWRRALVAIPGPNAFRRTRLDRNRNLITAAEQQQLSTLRVGVVGLSVGHVIAHTLAMAGLCGELRLADFDTLELSNLNRVPATLLDLGVNKATAAARRISELDPYLHITTMPDGVTADTVGEFLDGLDIVVEECDSLDIKVIVREAARQRHLPVIMSTSDRGMVDVERFDQEPDRAILHGLLTGVNSADLAGLSSRDKIPHMLGLLEIARVSPRTAASMVEVDVSVSTWPQLAGEVTLGAAVVVEAVRRIGLGEELPSGRTRVDIGASFAALHQPGPTSSGPGRGGTARQTGHGADLTVCDRLAEAATLAPSAGNAQPWRITTGTDTVFVEIDPDRSSTLDVGFRGSAVAVGAAVFNARVAAAALRVPASVEYCEGGATVLRAAVRPGTGNDSDLARLHTPMLRRHTNRRAGGAGCLGTDAAEQFTLAAKREGAELHILDTDPQIEEAAHIIAATDRIRFLTPRLHQEMIAEIRWPGDADPDTGLEVASLEFDADDEAALAIVRRPEVMAHLAAWRAGTSLGDNTRDRITASSAVAMLTVHDHSLVGYARGGEAAEAMWLTAQELGLGIHPVSPLFLYARDDAELAELSPPFTPELAELRAQLRELFGLSPDESPVLVFRVTDAPSPDRRSRRRSSVRDDRGEAT